MGHFDYVVAPTAAAKLHTIACRYSVRLTTGLQNLGAGIVGGIAGGQIARWWLPSFGPFWLSVLVHMVVVVVGALVTRVFLVAGLQQRRLRILNKQIKRGNVLVFCWQTYNSFLARMAETGHADEWNLGMLWVRLERFSDLKCIFDLLQSPDKSHAVQALRVTQMFAVLADEFNERKDASKPSA
ncbi:MAG TPA: hypothetical protein VFO38_02710 [Candidatus Saccharimonadales bacterium]|nr:hypothetical protein [Candidatus Saccharimonadales bacterium]